MSLFEYAQEVVSKKLEREKPMLSVSMGGLPMTDKMQTYMNRPVLPNTPAGKMDGSPFMEAAEKRGIPTTNKNMNMMVDLVNRGVPLQEAANLTEQKLMPMAQGGGLSSVQNSLNINGQPHRLAYINPNEEDLLKALGGSGRDVDGIPAYDSSSDDADSEDSGTTGGNAESSADDADSEDSGTTGANAEPGPGTPGGYGDTFDTPNISYSVPEATFDARSEQNLGPPDTFSVNPATVAIGATLGPVAAAIANAIGIGKSMSFDISIPGSETPGGYGDTGTGNQGGSGQPGDDADDDGDDSGGDDIIIKEKIAAVKEVPVEDVSDVEVTRVKQTAKERIAGTNIEDIIRQMYGVAQANRLLNINRQPTEEEEEINHRADLIDSIYGPGSSAGLLGITTNNTGTA
jgi:hypothetical protein